MFRTISLTATLVLAGTVGVSAQSAPASGETTAGALGLAPGALESIDGEALIGAPLGTSYSDSLSLASDSELETVFVIDTGTVKPVGEWTAADRKACSDAGGVELEIAAGRIACFNL